MRMMAVALIGLVLAHPVRAEVPQVITDIAPVHSLVAKVMDGVGEPILLIEPTASPHGYSLRPSQARALSKADLVIWVGEGLTPWLEGPLENLAGGAEVVELSALKAVTRLSNRGGESHAEDDDHGHGDLDPHIWLDPVNGAEILSIAAEFLSKADPANADRYRTNAERATREIDGLVTEVSGSLNAVKDRPYIVFHDAYQYFEVRFGIKASGYVTPGDAARPGARRISEIRALLADTKAQCIFAEPQFPESTVAAILRGSDARLAVLDPMGAGLEPGPSLYAALIRALANDLSECLK